MSSLHERAGEVFLAALSRPAAERDAFLVAACRGDEELLREVGSLLMFHEGEDAADADPVAERQDFSAGDVFAGRYRMIARVGRGGMGDVWRADDLILETPVALKLMRVGKPVRPQPHPSGGTTRAANHASGGVPGLRCRRSRRDDLLLDGVRAGRGSRGPAQAHAAV